jgi:aryl-alcohol dehydrogenase-like predicted oxidoreductase
VAQIEEARGIVENAAVQVRLSLPAPETLLAVVLEYCERHGIGFIPWFPIATGELARPGGPLEGMSRESGATPAQLALAWLLRRSPVMLPIPGTSSVAHVEENCAAATIQLTDAEFDALAKAA